jgi:hypothetical protein
VCPEDDVDPRGLLDHDVLVLLRHAPPDRDLHAGVLRLDLLELTEGPVEAVVGVLPHRTGVEDDDVGGRAAGGGDVPGILQETGEALGIVDVHLAPEGADLVRSGTPVARPGHFCSASGFNHGPRV